MSKSNRGMYKGVVSVSLMLILLVSLLRAADGLALQEVKAVEGAVETRWQVLSAGAQTGRAEHMVLSGTIGQALSGAGESAGNLAIAGFWQDFCCVLRGDANHDRTTNISDLTFLIGYLFRGGPRPVCDEEGNVDGQGAVNIADLTFLIGFLFRGGEVPPPCSP